MDELRIQWYPGHMAKTRRALVEALGRVDVVCELLDARIPRSSRNPDISELLGAKPRVILLNRADQADPALTDAWADALSVGGEVLKTDAKSGTGINAFAGAVRRAATERIEKLERAGRKGGVRAMIVGIPNVGKSSLINRLAGGARAVAENRPGVTRKEQWFYLGEGLELLDTPGMLWPKFDDPEVGLDLAFTGAIRDEILDIEGLAAQLCIRLCDIAPDAFAARYSLDIEAAKANAFELPGGGSTLGGELLEQIGRRRGCLMSGGEVDTLRASRLLLDDFRSCKIGRITLERPENA